MCFCHMWIWGIERDFGEHGPYTSAEGSVSEASP